MLIIQHGANLPNNFSGRQVAFHSQQRRQTELAIHCAPNLAGNTDRGSIPSALRLAAISSFAAVAFGHPDGLHALAVDEIH